MTFIGSTLTYVTSGEPIGKRPAARRARTCCWDRKWTQRRLRQSVAAHGADAAARRVSAPAGAAAALTGGAGFRARASAAAGFATAARAFAALAGVAGGAFAAERIAATSSEQDDRYTQRVR